MDASNYTGAFTGQMMQDLKAAGVVGVIIQAIAPPAPYPPGVTSQQCQVAVANGLRIQGYVWCFPGESAVSVDTRLRLFDNYPVEKLWADIEQSGLSKRDGDTLVSRCDLYNRNQRTGVYSGKWFFDQQGWSGHSYWADRDLWDAHYDNQANTNVDFVPYGGWDHCVVKQFRGTSDIGHVHEIDLDVM